MSSQLTAADSTRPSVRARLAPLSPCCSVFNSDRTSIGFFIWVCWRKKAWNLFLDLHVCYYLFAHHTSHVFTQSYRAEIGIPPIASTCTRVTIGWFQFLCQRKRTATQCGCDRYTKGPESDGKVHRQHSDAKLVQNSERRWPQPSDQPWIWTGNRWMRLQPPCLPVPVSYVESLWRSL